jgi:hypothetical protein
MVGFFIDGLILDPLDTSEETIEGSLGCMVAVEAETFTRSQIEILEIHKAIKSILHLDQSLGSIMKTGGLVKIIRWTGYRNPIMDVNEMREPFIAMVFYYRIKFTEMIH